MLTDQNIYNRDGKVEWISVRPLKKAIPESKDEVVAAVGKGLVGDHYSGSSGKREVTIIQKEHIEVVKTLLEKNEIDPKLLRRNIVISGINLFSFKERQISIGNDVVLEITGTCPPCNQMEANLGKGGYNAMRGHGGMTAKVIKGGNIRLNDRVKPIL